MLALLAAAYVAYASIVRSHRAMAADSSWTTLLVLPLVAFPWDARVPCAIAPLLGSIHLPPGSPALVSFWIAVSGGSGFSRRAAVGILAGFTLVGTALEEFQPVRPRRHPVCRDGNGHRGVSCRPAAALFGRAFARRVGADETSVVALTYLLGRTLGLYRPAPLSVGICSLGLTMPDGRRIAPCHGHVVRAGNGVDHGNGGRPAVLDIRRSKRHGADADACPGGSPAGRRDSPAASPPTCRSWPGAENPVFQPSPAFARHGITWAAFSMAAAAIWGCSAAAARARPPRLQPLPNRLIKEFKKRGVSARALVRDLSSADQRAHFLRSLLSGAAQHFEVNLLAPPGPKLQQISQALGGLFGSVIPFARILFPHSAGDGDTAARPEEINASIAWMLRRLAKTRPILLFLDDVQWLDDASAALVAVSAQGVSRRGQDAAGDHARCPRRIDPCRFGVRRRRKGGRDSLPVAGAAGGDPGARRGSASSRRARDSGALRRGTEKRRRTALAAAGCGTTRPLRARWCAARKDSAGPTAVWPADFTIPGHIRAAIEEQWESAANIVRFWNVRRAAQAAASSMPACLPPPWAGAASIS